MKRQTIIALGAAIILGLVAVFLANSYLTGRERQVEKSQEQHVRIAVASLPLNYGAEITPDKVKFINYPANSLPPGTYKTIAALLPQGKRRVALRPIQVNQPLLAADLSGEGQSASIAALLPDGMRAATVRINDISGVAGFIKPNDTVDVLITRQALNGPNEQVTDVLLQNIRVIAMGGDAVGSDGKRSSTRSSTLELTPLDAQKITLGQQLGSLSLTLRKPGEDQNIPNIETVSLDDLRYSYYGSLPPGAKLAGAAANRPAMSPPPEVRQQRIARLSQPRRRPPAPRTAGPPMPSTNTVVVTRGTQDSSYEVGDYVR